ncbi:MAG: aspartate carbamoyltransferase [Clostridia bacterium]|nr:aspartate carbamoyltransferase [Clostridia bacterium]
MGIRHLIDFSNIDVARWNELAKLTNEIIDSPQDFASACKGKVLATLFYEPSTRTKFSFQTAMLRLGGSYIGFDNAENSSVSKGETLRDTIKIVNNYADIIAMRHPYEGAAYAATLYSSTPVINAGDGGHMHPTQTLADLTTMMREKGTLEGLKIGICGDLKYGRTVHSLLKAMSLFKNNKFYLISTESLSTPKYIIDEIVKSGNSYVECDSLDKYIDEFDCLYMTRIQQERFASEEEYLAQKGIFVLDEAKMKKARKDLIIMHPLPKIDEITDEVDFDPRALYFKQAKYGMYARMALIKTLLSEDFELPERPALSNLNNVFCSNHKCITRLEPNLPAQFGGEEGARFCKYCDFEAIEWR